MNTKKCLQKIKNIWLENWKFIITLVVIILLFTIKLPYKIYTPGGLVNLNDRVTVDNGYSSDGEIAMSYVSMVDGTIPFLLASYIIPDWDIVAETDITYPDETMDEMLKAEKIETKQSIDSATIAAYKAANANINITNQYFNVLYVDTNAETDIKLFDKIESINGQVIHTSEELKDVVQSCYEGEVVKVKVIRDDEEIECNSTIYNTDDGLKLGVMVTSTYDYEETPTSSIKMTESESGPSGGLMMTLALYNSLVPEDITKGKIIAGTGTIDVDGNVGEIGGVRYKLIGAVYGKADVFLVPKENYDEAVSVKEEKGYDINIIEVSTLSDAINTLQSLNN